MDNFSNQHQKYQMLPFDQMRLDLTAHGFNEKIEEAIAEWEIPEALYYLREIILEIMRSEKTTARKHY